jgi:hypothetical protein
MAARMAILRDGRAVRLVELTWREMILAHLRTGRRKEVRVSRLAGHSCEWDGPDDRFGIGSWTITWRRGLRIGTSSLATSGYLTLAGHVEVRVGELGSWDDASGARCGGAQCRSMYHGCEPSRRSSEIGFGSTTSGTGARINSDTVGLGPPLRPCARASSSGHGPPWCARRPAAWRVPRPLWCASHEGLWRGLMFSESRKILFAKSWLAVPSAGLEVRPRNRAGRWPGHS